MRLVVGVRRPNILASRALRRSFSAAAPATDFRRTFDAETGVPIPVVVADEGTTAVAVVRRFRRLTDLTQTSDAHVFSFIADGYQSVGGERLNTHPPVPQNVLRSRLLLGLSAVFAGITVSLTILGLWYNLFLVIFAIPFGITTAILWYHATGRLQKKVEREAAYRDPNRGFGSPRGGGRRRTRQRTRGQSRARTSSRARERARWQAREQARWEAREGDRRRATVNGSSGPSPAEAYRILGLDVDADDEAVREAYREKVKDVHPDRANGNEEAFKRVNRAYERVRSDR
ncbi:DnaJ domain-containing protein [Haladaptatus litoreus]|uniref:DnaJ domain-containing protein n=1 Tax=Haladaptatus litoreus TaxID=553468 RepID=A0A1N6ZQJ6_9EURY|nr:DnaJ domain-containing protein [Haladaptatus litoreus]